MLGNRPHVLGKGNGLLVLGNELHVLNVTLHSGLCHIQYYVAFGRMSFEIMSFGIMLHLGLCCLGLGRIWTYVVRVNVVGVNVVQPNVIRHNVSVSYLFHQSIPSGHLKKGSTIF